MDDLGGQPFGLCVLGRRAWAISVPFEGHPAPTLRVGQVDGGLPFGGASRRQRDARSTASRPAANALGVAPVMASACVNCVKPSINSVRGCVGRFCSFHRLAIATARERSGCVSEIAKCSLTLTYNEPACW